MRIENLKLRIMRGFTLVELLVVIGVLGILIAGLLATIDPLEQLRKGRDSNKKTAAIEFVNASNRYYITYGYVPWRPETGGSADCFISVISGTPLSNFGACIQELITKGELKSTFAEQATSLLGVLYATTAGTSEEQMSICYNPESKVESLRAETKYFNTGTENAACGSTKTAESDCYWCAR